MVKDIVKRYVKDRLLIVSFYLINMVCVISFFYLSVPQHTEFLYPFSIGIFLLLIYLVIDGVRYYQVNRAVELKLKNQLAEIEPYTEEQKAFCQLLDKMIHEHNHIYYALREQHQERIYFLSHWMHHLKTPVSVIKLIIDKEEKSPEAVPVYERISQENNRLHTSIEQGLTVLRMDKFENDIEVTSINLLDSLRKLINERKKEFIYLSIFPSIECEESDVYVVTDSKWNEILLNQLISNAVKYSSTKKGRKNLIFQVEKSEQHITLFIKDEGVGIPPYDLDRLFQPFFTGENGRRFSHSTGIGLYLCKKIADKLSQTLTVHSDVSGGTTVEVRWLNGVRSEV